MIKFKYLDKVAHNAFIEGLIKNKEMTQVNKIDELSNYLKELNTSKFSTADYFACRKVQHDLILEFFNPIYHFKGHFRDIEIIEDVNSHYYIYNRKLGIIYGLTEIFIQQESDICKWFKAIGRDVLGYEIERRGGAKRDLSIPSFDNLCVKNFYYGEMAELFGRDKTYADSFHFFDHLFQKRKMGIGFLHQAHFSEDEHDELLFARIMDELLAIRPWLTTMDICAQKGKQRPKDENKWYDLHFLGEVVPSWDIFKEARMHLLPSETVDYFNKTINSIYLKAVNNRVPVEDYGY